MADTRLKLDPNRKNVMGAVESSSGDIVPVLADDATGRILVDATITTGLSAQTGVTDGEAVDAADTGALVLGTDGSNYQILHTDSSGDLQVDVLTVPRSLMGPAQPGTAIDSYTHAAINLAAGANQVLVSSAASKQIWVYGISFVVNAAGTVSFQDEDDVAVTGIMPFAANSGLGIPPSGNFSMPIWKLGTDKDLEVDIVTSELDGWLDYAIVSV